MTDGKIIEVLVLYKARLDEMGVIPRRFSPEQYEMGFDEIPREVHLAHLSALCDGALAKLDAGENLQPMRWMVYIQTILYALGVYTVADNKRHVKPDDQPFKTYC